MTRAAMLMTLVAGACSSSAARRGGGGEGAAVAGGCDAVQAKVEALYRAEAQAREPARVDEYVADNTAMVMRACARPGASAAVSTCIAGVTTVKDLEASCMPTLDDEGSEADTLRQ